MACHPWRPPCGPSLRDVKNDSRSFFMACYAWRPPCGPALRDVKNGSRPFFASRESVTALVLALQHIRPDLPGVGGLIIEKRPLAHSLFGRTQTHLVDQ